MSTSTRPASVFDDLPGAWCWIVVSSTPDEQITDSGAGRNGGLQDWLRGEVGAWPAPIPLGLHEPSFTHGAATFAPEDPHSLGLGQADQYHCRLRPDGSALLALPVGDLQTNPSDGASVWRIGEGAVAWIAIAGLHLAAAHAVRSGAHGAASIELSIGVADGGDGTPYEVWNRDDQGFRPVGERIDVVRPARTSVDLAACLSASLPQAARPLVLDQLEQFGLPGTRHIEPDGVVRRRNFAGQGDRILAWTSAIGVLSAW